MLMLAIPLMMLMMWLPIMMTDAADDDDDDDDGDGGGGDDCYADAYDHDDYAAADDADTMMTHMMIMLR